MRLTVKDEAACVVPEPKVLKARVESGWQPPIAGGQFQALTVVGETVYGAGGAEGDIYAVDLGAKKVAKLATTSGGASPAWMIASPRHLAWLTYDSAQDPTAWTLYAADRSGSNRKKVAGSPADHREGEGRATQPAMVGERLAWTESLGGRNDLSALKVMDLDTGRASTVAQGNLFPPVAMGTSFVWGELAKGQWSLHAADAATMKPSTLPSDLPLKNGIGHLAATPERLLWGSADYTTLSVWEPAKSSVVRYRLPAGDGHAFQFLQPTGNHVAWFASWPYSILDLRSGALYDVGKDVSVAAANGTVAVSWEKKLSAGNSGPRAPAKVSVIAEADLPPAPPCR
ncbi:MAG: hypothetical protein L0H96_19290 [Humibacillus sp.]|nr:hypothetical protein [Humibacillus sp.]MDN5779044.1 hypothetical protein [Humibacillus sp.]